MEDRKEIPLMLTLLYGEGATDFVAATNDIDPQRLSGWCRAFDEWLADKYKPGQKKKSLAAWRRLLRQCPKMPWELAQADIEGHIAWLQAQGYAGSTVGFSLRTFSDFYRWCGEWGVDPACGTGFNPAAGVQKPVVRRFSGRNLLSPAEVQALLGILHRDDTPLGRRDYAFFLARLRLGVPLTALRRLQWGQIEPDEAQAWVRWRPEGARTQLPQEVWEAIRVYLAGSGRLAGMRAEAYIFAPLVENVTEAAGSAADDWREERPLVNYQLLRIVKLYGRLAGIPVEKLTMNVLRNTAIRLYLDEGHSPEQVRAFLDSQDFRWKTTSRLRGLPELPEGEITNQQIGDSANQGSEPRLPVRKGKLFKPGDNATHGLYAKVQPLEEVKAILAEGDQGIDEQIVGLRILARGLLYCSNEEGCSSAQAARLSAAYLQAVGRLAELVRAEPQLPASSKGISDNAKEFIDRLNDAAQEMGDPPMITHDFLEEIRHSEPELAEASRLLREETASIRYVLRNTFRRAMEAQETEEYIRLVGTYGTACVRLVRLLKMKGSDSDRIDAYFQNAIEQALNDVIKEFGLE